jgi:ferric-dicitrate binding protein FerR (iron transport regulator)
MLGTVDRDHATRVGAFSAARVGDDFRVGDGIRTGLGARADLRLVEGSQLTLEPSTLLRFTARTGERGPRLELELGQVVLTAGSAPLTISTSFGEAVVQPNSSLRLTRSAAGAKFEVTFGSAVVNREGKSQELGATQKIEVGTQPAAADRAADAGPAGSASVAPPGSASPEGTLSLEVTGDDARIQAPDQREFVPLASGKSLVPEGSRLRLGADTSAVLHAAEGGVRLVGAGTFSLGGSGDARVRAEAGRLELAPQSNTVTVAVPGGTIRVLAGSRASLRTEDSGTKLSVAQGSMAVESGQAKETLRSGEKGLLKRSGALERLRTRGPDYADFRIVAGESCVVHDPKPPSVVGLESSKRCEGSAVVELGGGSNKTEVVGDKTLNVALRPGSHPYVVRCLNAEGEGTEEVARGSITVMSDAGTRRLPTQAASSVIDADGRNYVVMYQNQLPSVTVRWPRAPGASSFVLTIKPPHGSAQTITTGAPQHTFVSGKLTEGTHQFTFEGGGVRAKPTTVEIRFDNATPAASIASPADSSFGAGAQVSVAGTSLPGSTVSVAGVELKQDDQHRFSGDVPAPASDRALAIRFVHPQRGTHYYLRRASGAAR